MQMPVPLKIGVCVALPCLYEARLLRRSVRCFGKAGAAFNEPRRFDVLYDQGVTRYFSPVFMAR